MNTLKQKLLNRNMNSFQYKIEKMKTLKRQLSETDYQAIKFAEGAMTEEEFAPIRMQRQQWRDEINNIQGGD